MAPSSMSLQIRETVERLIPDSLPRALTRSSTLRVETPSIQAEQITAYRALSTLRRGWSRDGKNEPVRSLGMAGFHLPGGGGHGLGPRAVAPVGALRRALIAPRADHGGGLGVDQVLQPGLEQTPEDVIVSQIGVGQDFPDQRGHGRLVRGGHRGCTPCESWSRNRAPTMPPPVPTTPGGSPAGIATTLRDAPNDPPRAPEPRSRRGCQLSSARCVNRSRRPPDHSLD